MRSVMLEWQVWALLSAGFAALTAVFGKIGVENINSDFATLLRTVIIFCVIVLIVAFSGAAQPLNAISRRTYLFLALSGLATGASWLCYYRALKLGPVSRVAPIDKLSIVLVALIGVAFLGEHLSPRNWAGLALVVLGAILVTA